MASISTSGLNGPLKSVGGGQCLVCGATHLHEIESYPTLGRVTSDFRPWPSGGRIAVCMDCGTTQKVLTDVWRSDCRTIYADYVAYRQGPDAEQSVFLDGKPVAESRSRVFLRWAMAAAGGEKCGHVLDFGCGDGSLLRNLSSMASGWRLSGYDLGEAYRGVVLALPGAVGFHTGPIEALPVGFDLITASHVVEHLETPIVQLSKLASRLGPGGALAIEVPDLARNPFDLLIVDHAAHYTRATLDALLARAGLALLAKSETVIPKELSTVVGAGVAAKPPSVDPREALASVEAHLAWLSQLRMRAMAAAAEGPVAIFGTAIAGTWLDAELGEAAKVFVDEDPGRQNVSYRGRRIVAPQAVPRDLPILVPLPAEVAPAVVGRLRDLGLQAVPL